MNQIKFLVCNINYKFPPDINELIFKKVQESSAVSIQRMYYNKVKLNMDAFTYFMSMSRWIGANPDEIHYINKMISFYSKKIKYTYIQEPGIWIDILIDIINRCRYFPEFHINNVYYVINNVERSNWIFKQTGIAWWENI